MSKCDKNTQMKKPTINKQYKDDWIVYEDSIPRPLKHPRTCTDTINTSTCESKSIDKCIQECDESAECSFGYHLKYADKSTKCLPLYTSDYYPSSNPTYSLKNHDCYNDLPIGVTSHAFISKKRWGKHGILPNEANAVFFEDIVLLGHRLKSNESFLKKHSNGKVSFQEFGGTKLKLLPEYGSGLTTRVEYGDHIAFNMVGDGDAFTSNIMIIKPDNLNKEYDNIVFKPYKNTFLSPEQKFTIIPFPGNKDFQFNYDSNFLLKTTRGYLQIRNINNILTLVINTTVNPHHNFTQFHHTDETDETVDIASMTFNFRPTKKIYTCENGTCTEHNLTDAKKHRRTATIKGNTAYTRNDCFGSCKWDSGNKIPTYPNSKAGMIKDTKDTPLGNEKECTNNWCASLTIVLGVLIILSILVLR
jgi:hypothetical protein